MNWQLHQAKARFSELVQKALDDGPQTVTRRGKPCVIPLDGLEIERDKTPPRRLEP
jgi:antitoxin Phd